MSTAAWIPELAGASAPTWPNVGLSFAIGGATGFAEIRREHILRFADDIGRPCRIAEKRNGLVAEASPQAADTVLREFEARADVPAGLRAGSCACSIPSAICRFRICNRRLA